MTDQPDEKESASVMRLIDQMNKVKHSQPETLDVQLANAKQRIRELEIRNASDSSRAQQQYRNLGLQSLVDKARVKALEDQRSEIISVLSE